jgi:GNAT superfamily N-acetyltransferase
MARLTIRQAHPEEADRLTAIALAAKRDWGYPDAWIAEWTPQLTLTPAYVREHAVFLALEGGGPVGFCALVEEPTCWVLDHLWVHPDAMGNGVGRGLFTHALEHLRDRGPRVLRIDADPNAVGFYERMGATRVGSVPAPVAGTARELPRLELGL